MVQQTGIDSPEWDFPIRIDKPFGSRLSLGCGYLLIGVTLGFLWFIPCALMVSRLYSDDERGFKAAVVCWLLTLTPWAIWFARRFWLRITGRLLIWPDRLEIERGQRRRVFPFAGMVLSYRESTRIRIQTPRGGTVLKSDWPFNEIQIALETIARPAITEVLLNEVSKGGKIQFREPFGWRALAAFALLFEITWGAVALLGLILGTGGEHLGDQIKLTFSGVIAIALIAPTLSMLRRPGVIASKEGIRRIGAPPSKTIPWTVSTFTGGVDDLRIAGARENKPIVVSSWCGNFRSLVELASVLAPESCPPSWRNFGLRLTPGPLQDVIKKQANNRRGGLSLWFHPKEKGELDAAVRAAGKVATEMIVEAAMPTDHVFPPTASHFGGNPYFESGESWPLFKGRPYDFVCQINLRDCPNKPDVPFDLFTVYYCWDIGEKPTDDEFNDQCLVRIYRQADALKAKTLLRPKPVDPSDYQVKPCSVRFQGGFMTYPWDFDEYPGIKAAAEKFRDPWGAFRQSLSRLKFIHDDRSRVGGFATWLHDNTLESDDMVLLAQIAYEPQAGNGIGDSAPIFIGVAPGDPPRIKTDATQSY